MRAPRTRAVVAGCVEGVGCVGRDVQGVPSTDEEQEHEKLTEGGLAWPSTPRARHAREGLVQALSAKANGQWPSIVFGFCQFSTMIDVLGTINKTARRNIYELKHTRL